MKKKVTESKPYLIFDMAGSVALILFVLAFTIYMFTESGFLLFPALLVLLVLIQNSIWIRTSWKRYREL